MRINKIIDEFKIASSNERFLNCARNREIQSKNATTIFTVLIKNCLYLIALPLATILLWIKYESKRRSRVIPSFTRITLCTSSAILRITKHAGYDISKEYYMLNMALPINKLIDQSHQFYAIDFVNKADVFEAFLKTIICCYFSIFNYPFFTSKKLITYLNYYIVQSALAKITDNVELVFCNQMDRWVYLFDNSHQINKTLIQHGTVIAKRVYSSDVFYTYNENKAFWTFNMPYKYTHLTRIKAFTEEEAVALKQACVIGNPLIEYIGYESKLTRLTDSFSVLIIGRYDMFGDVETRILEELKGLNIKIFIKNHPVLDPSWYDKLYKKYSFTLITDNTYPQVNLVFSYESTLANEYMSYGIDVIYYYDLQKQNVSNIIAEKINGSKGAS